jgi:uncharacterized membrane protein YkgB
MLGLREKLLFVNNFILPVIFLKNVFEYFVVTKSLYTFIPGGSLVQKDTLIIAYGHVIFAVSLRKVFYKVSYALPLGI